MKYWVYALFFLQALPVVAQTVSQHPTHDPFSILSEAERDYYELAFSYALGAVDDNVAYKWKSSASSGSVTPGKRFTTDKNVECRSFSESYVLYGNQGTTTGYGCKRQGHEGWCKLKIGDALTCALEAPDSVYGSAEKKASRVVTESWDKFHAVEAEWDWWPFD